MKRITENLSIDNYYYKKLLFIHFLTTKLFLTGIFSNWGVGVQAFMGLRWLSELPF